MSNDIKLPLRLPQLRVLGQRQREGLIEVKVAYRRLYAACPRCEYHSRNVHDRRWQKKLDIPLHGQTLILLLWKRRFRCPACGKVFTEPDEVCGWRRRTTARLRHELAEQGRHQTVKQVAKLYGVGERFVRESFAHYVAQELAAVGLAEHVPVVLGMDDFSVRKGQRYETLFCDVNLHRRLEVVEGRDSDAVRGYLDRLAEPEQVRVVVMDMSLAYRSAVELCLPQAQIVVDKMHVVALVNRALDKVRLRVQRAQGKEKGRTLYEGRYLLLRNPEELDQRDSNRLARLLRDYRALRRPWQLKEEFRRWYREADLGDARLELRAWEREVAAGGPPEYAALLPTIDHWREQILHYFRYDVTNAYLEGSNNRTKAIQRQAYGYRNMGNLRLRILLPKAA
jgi:transposase